MKGIGTRNSLDNCQPPDTVTSTVFASTAPQAFDIPTGARFAGFSFNGDIAVKFGSTAAQWPATASSAANTGTSASEINPGIRNFGSTLGSTVMSIAPAAACQGTISWWM